MAAHGTPRQRSRSASLPDDAAATADRHGSVEAEPDESRAWPAHDDALTLQQEWLRFAEDDLQQRERDALAKGMTPAELLAFAAERDSIASDRDMLADAQDEQAAGRDRRGFRRDVAGSGRDRAARRVAEDYDPGFADRSVAGVDRDFAAGDRTDSHDDRARSHDAREHAAADRATAAADRQRASDQAASDARELVGLRAALETRATVGQAQGMLMARHNMSAEAAFAVLTRLSQHSNIKLRDVAARMIADAATDRA